MDYLILYCILSYFIISLTGYYHIKKNEEANFSITLFLTLISPITFPLMILTMILKKNEKI